ncbi:CAR family subclass B3 metallo-beta-lactamase [Pectobacterium peruviense]|uniref:CAR family subclass B3 metallo-beta-lactamase n=1 Tax=Pectobacterium peruviense TaxID=2066479 RepID=UPI000DE32502|nr:CAR family subclass B3 metallo-beta-lactamase [Pectobacterium peruviense]
MKNQRLMPLAAFLLLISMAATAHTNPAQSTERKDLKTNGPAITSLTGCGPSSTINQLFNQFGNSGKMPAELGSWLNDAKAQTVEPYQAFDNVYYVGICWVSAWLIKTSEGPVLIDTLYGEFTDQLIDNIKKIGVEPADIKMVLLTHGHFDHVGGVSKLKSFTNARFVMSEEGWKEAQADANKTQGKPNAWTMPDPATTDILVKNGSALSVGDTTFYAYITPGHTWGTTSYVFDIKEGNNTYRAMTIGGLGLNAIDGPQQVEAYIRSIDRIKAMVEDDKHPITVHLTAHPFSNGQIEIQNQLKVRQPNQPHPMVDAEGLLKQLATLRAGAVERLAVEQARIQK